MTDFRKMLPSAAKQALKQAIFEKLEAARLNMHSEPVYSLTDAYGDFREQIWDTSLIDEAFKQAKADYYEKHPAAWSLDRQETYREGKP